MLEIVGNHIYCVFTLVQDAFLPEAYVDSFYFNTGRKRAVVAKPRACTLCRECVKVAEKVKDKVNVADVKGKVADEEVDDEVEPQVELRRVRDHFICKYLTT